MFLKNVVFLYEFLLKYLEKSLVFKKDNEKVEFSIKPEQPKKK